MRHPRLWDTRGMPPGKPAPIFGPETDPYGAPVRPPMSPHQPTVIDAKWDQGKWNAMKAREAEQIVPVLAPMYTRLYRIMLWSSGFVAGACTAVAVIALVHR